MQFLLYVKWMKMHSAYDERKKKKDSACIGLRWVSLATVHVAKHC